MILFGQMGVLGLIYYLREERLYPSARRFMTHQKLKDVLRPALDKIIFIGLVSIWKYEETIFSKTNCRLDELNEIMYGKVLCMLLSIKPITYWRCFGSVITLSSFQAYDRHLNLCSPPLRTSLDKPLTLSEAFSQVYKNVANVISRHLGQCLA